MTKIKRFYSKLSVAKVMFMSFLFLFCGFYIAGTLNSIGQTTARNKINKQEREK
jgi:hypothetical protein